MVYLEINHFFFLVIKLVISPLFLSCIIFFPRSTDCLMDIVQFFYRDLQTASVSVSTYF